MASLPKPTIKGIFVNSHVERIKKDKGDAGIQELQHRFGKPLNFNNTDNVPISEEVRLIECTLDILGISSSDSHQRAFEAGRLHFTNFSTTPLAKIIFSMFRTNFKLLMLNTKNIAGHVFEGVKFESHDLGEKSVKVRMENNDYPIEHFSGLFSEWMKFAGLEGTVEAKEPEPNAYEYTMTWK